MHLNVSEVKVNGERFFTGIVRDITEIEKSQKVLARRVLESDLLQRATQLAVEIDSFEEAIHQCLDIVCNLTKWPIGHAYLISENRAVLESTKIWHLTDRTAQLTFRKITEKTNFAKGIGLPGRIWESGEPAWIANVQKDSNFPRNKLCADIQVSGAFGFPIKMQGEVIAVLEFFTEEEILPDEHLLEAIRNVGNQLSHVFERKQAQKKLETSREVAFEAKKPTRQKVNFWPI